MKYHKGDLVRIKDNTEAFDGCQGVINSIDGEYIYVTIAGYDSNFHEAELYRFEIEHWYPRKEKVELPEELFHV